MKQTKKQNTVLRLFSYLHDQRIRLTVVVVSILIYVGLSIWNPMYSAVVIDHLWIRIQAAWKIRRRMNRQRMERTAGSLFYRR